MMEVKNGNKSSWSGKEHGTQNPSPCSWNFPECFPCSVHPNPLKCSLARPTPRWNFPAGIFQQGFPCIEFLYQIKIPIKAHASQNSHSSSAIPRLLLSLFIVYLLFLGFKSPKDSWGAAEGIAEFPLPFPPGFLQRRLPSGNLGTIFYFHALFIPGNFQVKKFQQTPRMV